MIHYHPDLKINLNSEVQNRMIKHCMRKLTKAYLPDETHEQQAYGLLGGKIKCHDIFIDEVYRCKLNYRNDPSVVTYMNQLVNRYAVPSDTPISQRGWVSKPEEVIEAVDHFDSLGLELLGSYHMHHPKSWKGNLPKDYPSEFDQKLAEDSNALMFIVSISAEDHYSIRAFYKGIKEKEIKVIHHAA